MALNAIKLSAKVGGGLKKLTIGRNVNLYDDGTAWVMLPWHMHVKCLKLISGSITKITYVDTSGMAANSDPISVQLGQETICDRTVAGFILSKTCVLEVYPS